MSRPYLVDLDQIDRSALDDYRRERIRERDMEREPGIRRPGTPFLRASLNIDPSCVALPCPACRGRVYVPRDSDAELVDCFGCDARLVTRQCLEGVSVVETGEVT